MKWLVRDGVSVYLCGWAHGCCELKCWYSCLCGCMSGVSCLGCDGIGLFLLNRVWDYTNMMCACACACMWCGVYVCGVVWCGVCLCGVLSVCTSSCKWLTLTLYGTEESSGMRSTSLSAGVWLVVVVGVSIGESCAS